MEIIKFYNDGCGPCIAVDNFLQDKGVAYKSYNAAKEPKKAVEYKLGFGVPVVILMDGETEVKRTKGYNIGELEAIIEAYEAA
jgi:glutaredoxin